MRAQLPWRLCARNQEEEAKRKYDEIVRRKRDRNSAMGMSLSDGGETGEYCIHLPTASNDDRRTGGSFGAGERDVVEIDGEERIQSRDVA
ncbi:hypothetical protein OsI_28817 [Oryza sativa Indica Group]|uniref:Uncharacterized protein n=1 Tax=Oryza sativa subsp. indica TaxID=39946 RepID=B8B9W2_ORYSI|nr:hypothetical protein OsI_28817 [Oryza sativa Indica Group]